MNLSNLFNGRTWSEYTGITQKPRRYYPRRNRFSEYQIQEIKTLKEKGLSYSEIAKLYNVSKSCIVGVVNRI